MTANAMAIRTRKPCYRRDDRAMRPICGTPDYEMKTNVKKPKVMSVKSKVKT